MGGGCYIFRLSRPLSDPDVLRHREGKKIGMLSNRRVWLNGAVAGGCLTLTLPALSDQKS